jgi:O-antigen/teichoic acid export membrane protein
MENSKKVAINTLAQYLGKGVSIVTSILVTMLLTRSLGVSSYGHYVLVLNIIMFGNAIAEWGMTFIATREASKSNKEHIWFDSLFSTRISTGLLAAIILGLFWNRWASEVDVRVGIVAITLLLLLAIKSWLQVVFQTQMSLWKLTIVDTISTVFFGLLIAWLGFINAVSLFNVIFSLVASALISVITGLIFIYKSKYRLKLQFNPQITKKLIYESMVMGAVLVIFSIYNRVDVFMLRAIRGDFEVGIYGLAYKIYENVIIGAAFFANSLFPLLSKKSSSEVDFKRVLTKSLLLLGTGGFGFAVITWILAPFMVEVLGGPEYVGAILALRWLCIPILFAYINHGLGYATIALGKQRVSAAIACSGLAVNLFANYLLIPKFGFVAAAAVTGVTEGTVMLFTSIYLWRRFFSRS